ncbi:MAG: hypothetical protein PHP69_00880 [Candidatus Omnitrophica bacterium]|nr:hypothetical protein [Candidatus Omnitrophota bacterium]MDD5080962.1 hypothetical protein [Candidatus Omnitrophota bacterium]MDD5440605.1 hypothetical protein [Candidatus Omnitrophota bacterium]
MRNNNYKYIILLLLFITGISTSLYAQGNDLPFNQLSLRDPFVAPEGFEDFDLITTDKAILEDLVTKLVINGIIIDGNKKFVILNTKILGENEVWDKKLLIQKITKDGIIVKYKELVVTVPYRKAE